MYPRLSFVQIGNPYDGLTVFSLAIVGTFKIRYVSLYLQIIVAIFIYGL